MKILFPVESRKDFAILKNFIYAAKNETFVLLDDFNKNETKNIEKELEKGSISYEKIRTGNFSKSAEGAKNWGSFVYCFTQLAESISPDFIIVLDTNLTMLAAATIGAHMNIPVVHVETRVNGNFPRMIKDAVIKFAHMHFVKNKKELERLLKLGERAKYIYNIGSGKKSVEEGIEVMRKTKITHELIQKILTYK